MLCRKADRNRCFRTRLDSSKLAPSRGFGMGFPPITPTWYLVAFTNLLRFYDWVSPIHSFDISLRTHTRQSSNVHQGRMTAMGQSPTAVFVHVTIISSCKERWLPFFSPGSRLLRSRDLSPSSSLTPTFRDDSSSLCHWR